MPQVKTWLKTDLSKPIPVVSLDGEMFNFDNQGNAIGVEVFENGTPVTLTGDVIGYIIRSDGTTVYVEGTKSENTATIVLPAVAYAILGVVTIVIRVINGEQKTVIAACKAHVTRSRTDDIVDPGEIIPSIEDLPVIVTSITTYYQASDSGSVVPSGTWSETMPTVNPGQFLWQKEVLTWNNSQTTTIYTVTRFGQDGASGSGSVDGVKVNGTTYSADPNGIVDIGTVVTDISGKLDTNQGSNNAGKFMKVGNDGELSPSDLPAMSTALHLTLAAGSWSSATPPTQTVSATGVTSDNNIYFTLDSSATQDQYDAAMIAQLFCTAQSAGTITVECRGEEPTENIPILVVILK